MLQYVAFRVLAFVAPLAPAGFAYWLCDRIGDLLYLLLGKRRAVVQRNLSVVLRGRAEGGNLNALVKATFREGMKYYYDTFRIPRLTNAELDSLVHAEGLERLIEALDRGKGAIVVTGHFGSPAIAVQVVAVRGYRITSVVEPVKPQKLFDLVNGVRGSRGVTLLPLGRDTFRDLAAILARNEIVGIVGDRDLQGTGVSVKLFGEETKLPAGPVLLALRTGAPLFPAYALRLKDGRFHGTICEPLELTRTGDLREDIRLNTQKVADALQAAIAGHPEQWIVFEPLWPDSTAAREVAR